MSTRNIQIAIPYDIDHRGLPALPIYKRQLPSLDQSRSEFSYVTSVGCSSPLVQNGRNRTGSVATARASVSFKQPTFYRAKTNPASPRASILAVGRKSIRTLFAAASNTKTSVKWFGKSKTKLIDESDALPIAKSKWRPSLNFILEDTELLPALITFMTSQYNEENILFLLCVRKLNAQIDMILSDSNNQTQQKRIIDFEIIGIYNQYIVNNAPKQVNLSYNCLVQTMSLRDRFGTFHLNDKKSIFQTCVSEIEKLITTSILAAFFNNDEFNTIAASRPLPPPISIFDHKSNESYLNLDSVPTSVSNTTALSYAECEIRTPEIETPRDSVTGNEYINFNIPNDLGNWDRSNNANDETNKFMISSNGYEQGYHEWKIKIVSTNEYRQEIGIVGSANNKINMSRFGICETPSFGARVVYGCAYNKSSNNSFFYASYGQGNKERCNKNLSSLAVHQNGWRNGDEIKVCLNLNKGNIKFYLNDKKIRRTLSVEKGIKYYPIIGFTGDCEYKVVQ